VDPHKFKFIYNAHHSQAQLQSEAWAVTIGGGGLGDEGIKIKLF